jgi:pimeloyl-ACP methyl ester carboxylesterase
MTSGYLQTPSGASVYYEYREQNSKLPLLVFLNGLSDDTTSWLPLLQLLETKRNVLLIDLIGQGKALARDQERNLDLSYEVTTTEQCAAFTQVLAHLNRREKFELVGFSYGGGVALEFASTYPERIEQLFLFLPFIIRLDMALPVQRYWYRQLDFLRQLPGPAQPVMRICENAYQNFLHQYMHVRYSARIPDRELREVAVQLSEGIMKFNAFSCLENLPERTVHLVTVERDSLVPRSLYSELWAKLPAEKKCSWLQIEDGEHLILEQAPLFLARWLDYLLDDSIEKKPQVYRGVAHALEVYDEKDEELPGFFTVDGFEKSFGA